MSLLDDLGGKLNKLTGKLKDADLGDKISEVGNNVADALSMGAKTAYGRAKNAAEVGGLKLKLADARKEEAAAFEKFGRRYMELHGEDADPDLLLLCFAERPLLRSLLLLVRRAAGHGKHTHTKQQHTPSKPP